MGRSSHNGRFEILSKVVEHLNIKSSLPKEVGVAKEGPPKASSGVLTALIGTYKRKARETDVTKKYMHLSSAVSDKPSH